MTTTRHNRASWAIGVLAVAQIAVGAVVVATHDDEVDHPDAWDPRIADLAAFVEEERGHEFDHPVTVEFLTPEQYSENSRTDESTLTDEEREEIQLADEMMRALGLVTGEFDLLASVNELSDTGTLAYYDSDAERVVVRGTEVTPALRITLVHELTHVLQDQEWDLDRLDDDSTSGEQAAWRALVEGDADRMGERYESRLTEEERASIEAEDGADETDLEAAGVPPALTAIFAMPYALGAGLVELLTAAGEDQLDAAFDDPPTTEEHLLDPLRFLGGDEPIDVAVPETDGAEVLDEGDFGAASLYIVLAERMPLVDALRAVTGWGGDAYAVYEHDGQTCVRIDVIGDNDAEDAELEAALAAWVAAAPAGTATSGRVDDVLRLESCDPGAAAVPGAGASLDALGLATLRVIAAASVLGAGGSEEQAACYGTRLVELVPIELLTADEPDEAQLGSLALEAAAACR